ncbi:MAG: HAD family hydrolase, partial [Dethiobacteria bacterium]
MSKVQLNDIEFFLLDMDGTIYLGDRLIDGSYDFLNLVKQQGKRYCFLTNNSSRGAEAYLRKLINLGIDAAREELVTSTDLLIYHLQKT